MEVIKKDTSVRLKVNNDCQWTCDFCHNEGTELPSNQTMRVSTHLDTNGITLPPLEPIPADPAVLDKLTPLLSMGINEVHLTGGEPTLHPQLPEIVGGLSQRGFAVKMTTNGQGGNLVMSQVAEAGIRGVNFSVLSLDPAQFLKTQRIQSLPWARRMVERGKATILHTKNLGVPVKINTAVLGEDDYPRVDAIRDFAQTNQIPLVLLPVVGERGTTEPAVLKYAAQNGTAIGETVYENNGKGSRHYTLPGGTRMDAKYIRPFHPSDLCTGCEHNGQSSCVEKFYGIRMELRAGDFFTRLCLQKSNERTVMPFDQFRQSGLINRLGA